MSSSALASARKRRSNAESASPMPETVGRPGSAAPGTGLTIQQVVAVVDKRLLVLESFMSETRSKPLNNTLSVAEQPVDLPTNLKEVLEEYGSRFDIIADELANIKNMMLSLQSFTMDVNKKLMEERVRILSAEEDTPLEREMALEH